MNEGAGRAWHGLTAAVVAAVALVSQMIFVFPGGSVIHGAPAALSSWVHQLIAYVTTLGIGCVQPASIGMAVSFLVGLVVMWHSDRRLSTGRWDRVALASSAELISDATRRPS